LQLDPKWLDGGTRGPFADYVFLIRVVSICDGCPVYSYQHLMVYITFAGGELSSCVSWALTTRRVAHHPVIHVTHYLIEIPEHVYRDKQGKNHK